MGDRSALAVSALFTGAGVSHFARPDFFEAIVPRWFPDAAVANQVSGAAEIGLGIAMIPRRTRRVAAWGLLGLLAAVYPANIDAAVNGVDVRKGDDGRFHRHEGEVADARNWIRLPFQFVLGAIVWRHTPRR
jgi:uncharacterized membrane protein